MTDCLKGEGILSCLESCEKKQQTANMIGPPPHTPPRRGLFKVRTLPLGRVKVSVMIIPVIQLKFIYYGRLYCQQRQI